MDKGHPVKAQPWYREPWPWLLMSGPAAVVVAGIATAVIAVRSFDGMVVDDYYRQGLAMNRVLAREAAAKRLGVAASVRFAPDRSRVRVVLDGPDRPGVLRLAIVHPTRTGEDQALTLAAGAPGEYEGPMRPVRSAMFRLRLEDAEGRWVLAGAWARADDNVRLQP